MKLTNKEIMVMRHFSPPLAIQRASGVAHASHLVAVTDRQEQGWGCIKEESGAVGEGLLLGGPWGSKVDCWSLMESGSCSKIYDILWKLQVGQAVHEDPMMTTKVYKQQYNNSRNLHLNTALFSRIIISRLESTSPHNLQSSTIMFCFMFYDQVISIHGYSQRQRRGAYDEGFANKGVLVNYPVC
ncbi:uncharacterized protein [Triticum aestivum]|uniref:uncharacterized protein n=1 Tax=Triticum aestivum TaxID=4565 RepID=UPI001D00250F|nr:uncharacterized protein LOC123072245 [Triticum aestivum]XP_044351746.1 uncharacterized protein LOC123072245 [Triticum aestivum]XP_044351747.1 uncharacterized protein LOC123072245 [Triticum aestivum]XP_044351748.1 uncharacterized protein LOC123072245 [Triticum aestivum]XP_044351749.1 uncharacterized protein LOC123072245 [Triticum aestivum]XP_044351750.1 uncharacterized protein LOC123072245 [Triticum aestivum]